MDPSLYRSNIFKFNLFRVFGLFALWIPIWVVYLVEMRGLSLTQVSILDAPFFLVTILAEVPTGAIADTFGRKTSMAIGAFLYAGAMLVFGLADTFPLLVLSYLLWALSNSFVSGADSAFLYDSLRAMGEEGEYTKVAGRSLAWGQGSAAAASLLGAPLAVVVDLSLPILASALFGFFAFLVALTLREPPRFEEGQAAGYWSTMRSGVRLAFDHPPLRYALIYGAVAFVFLTMVVNLFFQPYARGLEVPVAWLGVLYVVLVRVPGLVGASVAHRLVDRIGERAWLYWAAAGMVLSTLILGQVYSREAMAAFPGMTFLYWLMRPVLEMIINRETPSAMRATVLSISMLLFSVLALPVEPFLGFLADGWGLPFALLSLGGGAGAALVLVLLRWVPFWQRGTEAGEPGVPQGM